MATAKQTPPGNAKIRLLAFNVSGSKAACNSADCHCRWLQRQWLADGRSPLAGAFAGATS